MVFSHWRIESGDEFSDEKNFLSLHLQQGELGFFMVSLIDKCFEIITSEDFPCYGRLTTHAFRYCQIDGRFRSKAAQKSTFWFDCRFFAALILYSNCVFA